MAVNSAAVKVFRKWTALLSSQILIVNYLLGGNTTSSLFLNFPARLALSHLEMFACFMRRLMGCTEKVHRPKHLGSVRFSIAVTRGLGLGLGHQLLCEREWRLHAVPPVL